MLLSKQILIWADCIWTEPSPPGLKKMVLRVGYTQRDRHAQRFGNNAIRF